MGTERVEDVIARLGAWQHGVVSRQQLLRAGIPRAVIDGRIEGNRLRPIHRGVYLVDAVEPPRARAMAAVLACGGAGVVGHRSVANLWGLLQDPRRGAPIDIITRSGDHTRRPGIRVHRVRSLRRDEITRLEGIPVTTVARTIYDLASSVPLRDLERAIARAFRSGLTTRAALEKQIRRHAGQPGTRRLKALIESDESPALTRSVAEERFLELVRKAGLPEPESNVYVCGHQVDFYWRSARLVVEVDGAAFHSSKDAFESDRQRDADLAAAGIRVIRVTWTRLVEEPEKLLVQLTRALGEPGPAPRAATARGRARGSRR